MTKNIKELFFAVGGFNVAETAVYVLLMTALHRVFTGVSA